MAENNTDVVSEAVREHYATIFEHSETSAMVDGNTITLRRRGPFHYCLIMTTPDGEFWNDIYLLHIHDETTNKTFHELDDLWAFLKGRIEVTSNSTDDNSVSCIEITPISVELRHYTRAVFTIKFKSDMTLDGRRFPINYEVRLYPGPVHITGRDMS